MKISKGLATWAGLVAAIGQYLGAVALFLQADDQAIALGPLATATATLWKVIEGRMNQATAKIEADGREPAAFATGYVSSSTASTTPITWNYATGTNIDPSKEVPGGGPESTDEPTT